ncbi:MAG: aminoacetone oxidase family FAD-binding enzyme [Clostridia bacterium]|nr:aminoacetone oxidase family FAD-binding enzyme [Clostridia bacterium]
MYDILIIGGGAAGLAAAVSAKRENKNVTVAIAEKGERVGRKILATGNGRCNFTNIDMSPDYFFGDGDFITKILEDFSTEDAIDFFAFLGVKHKIFEGRVYPLSNKASAVLDALRFFCEENGVEFLTGKNITNLSCGKSFDSDGIKAEKVIVATGGKAAPAFGSDGAGFALLKSFGHTILPQKAALVSIKTETAQIAGLKGVKAYARVSALGKDGKELFSDKGDLLFTDYGISGIPAMQISRFAEKGCRVKIDLMPDLAFNEVSDELRERIYKFPERKIENLYSGMMDKKLALAMLRYAEIRDLNAPAKSLNDKNVRKCGEFLKNLRLKILGDTGWQNAQTTVGGADLREFDAETMESKLKKNLYAAGEVLSCDALCGGYNLHWAWATGMKAGKSTAKDLR